jgi:GAF domain-containing protein
MTMASLGIDELLTELAVLAACREGDGGPSCAIALHASGLPGAIACSDELAARLEEIQREIKDGPCLTAMRTGQVASVENTGERAQWAEFATRAAAEGVGSSLSVPLTVGGRQVGALNLYAPDAGAFGEARLRWAHGVATAVSGILALAVSRAEQAALVAHLRAALSTRAVIDQALGIVMAQQGCTSDEAFGVLRRASQSRNVKLRDVAAGIVTGISGHPPRRPSFPLHSLDGKPARVPGRPARPGAEVLGRAAGDGSTDSKTAENR